VSVERFHAYSEILLAVTNNDHEKQARQQIKIDADKLREQEKRDEEYKIKLIKKKKLKRDLENYQKLVQQEINYTRMKEKHAENKKMAQIQNEIDSVLNKTEEVKVLHPKIISLRRPVQTHRQDLL
jgi:hypothetical protein